MDHKATGTEDYEVFWGLMHKEWNNFVEREEAKKILSEEIAKHSAKKVHMQYPFEIKIIELCNIGKKQNKPHQTISMDGQVTPLILTARQCPRERGVTMKGLNEDFSCEFCRFSIKTLIEMAEIGGRKEMFSTFKRLDNLMNIYEVNTESGYIVMRRSTGRFTDELSIDALIQVHNLVHTGKISLDPHEIDSNKETYKWGNYIASLLRHLGCQKFV